MQDQINRLADEMPAKDASAKAVIVRYKPHPELKISFLDRSHANSKKSGWPSFITPRSIEEMHEMADGLAKAFKDRPGYSSPERYLRGHVPHSRSSAWGNWVDSLYATICYLTFETKHSEYLRNWMEGSIENRYVLYISPYLSMDVIADPTRQKGFL
jgi:hypothetical protein